MDLDTYSPEMTYFTVVAPTLQDATCIKEAIKNSFEEHGLSEIIEKIAFIGSDEASVNSAKDSGLARLFQDNSPDVSFIWCFSHWLE